MNNEKVLLANLNILLESRTKHEPQIEKINRLHQKLSLRSPKLPLVVNHQNGQKIIDMYQNGTERAKQELSLLARIEENIDILLLNSYQSTSTSKSKEILPIGPSYMPITTSFTPVVSSVGHILIQPERSSTPLSNHQLQKRKSDDSIDRPTLYTSSSVGATYSSLSTIVAKSLIPKEKKVSKQSEDSNQGRSLEIIPIGKRVAVKPPSSDWILAVVLGYNSETRKYTVEDIEDDEKVPGLKKKYIFPAKSVLQVGLIRGIEFSSGSTVLALYPNSSCFYPALVISPPSKIKDALYQGYYSVKFEDDDYHTQHVLSTMVLEYPKKHMKVHSI